MPQSYTPEFRKKIVRLHTEEGRTYKSITAEYGCELPEILNLKASGLSSLTALYSGKVCSTFSEKGALLFRKGCTFASEYS